MLTISVRSVDAHIAGALRRLNLANRTHLATWATEHRLGAYRLLVVIRSRLSRPAPP